MSRYRRGICSVCGAAMLMVPRPSPDPRYVEDEETNKYELVPHFMLGTRNGCAGSFTSPKSFIWSSKGYFNSDPNFLGNTIVP